MPEEPEGHSCTHEFTCGFCRARRNEVRNLHNNFDSFRKEIKGLRDKLDDCEEVITGLRAAHQSGSREEWEAAVKVAVGLFTGYHYKHPVGDYCVFCHAQWPCEESEEVNG